MRSRDLDLKACRFQHSDRGTEILGFEIGVERIREYHDVGCAAAVALGLGAAEIVLAPDRQAPAGRQSEE